MQPTGLVKSKINSQATDFKGAFSNASRKGQWLGRRLKELGWTAAFSSVFIFAQSYALSLQGIQINSALGEPLDAVVVVNAAPGESLQASCMRAASDPASGMPGIIGVRLSLTRQISPGSLRLTTRQPISEPMSEVVVQIECPGAPTIKRSFLIMLDPQGVTDAARNRQSTQALVAAADQSPANRGSRPSVTPIITSDDTRVNVNSRKESVSRGLPIDAGSGYKVRRGDALSTIASRIRGRDYGTVWSWAATIAAANPHAFINGNPNELIAGSELYIPITLTANSASLTVTQGNQAANDSSGRYSDRFSTSTGTQNAADNNSTTENDSSSEAPVVITASQPAPASGAIRAIQPVMVMATSFSGVSRERLRQRNNGLIQAAPNNLPNFGPDANVAPDAPAPDPEQGQSPAVPAAAKPEAAVVATSGRRYSIFGLLAGLGLLAVSFFTGWWLSRRRADAEMEEQVEARLSEERYHERVRTDHQGVTREVLSGGAAAGMEVTESPADDDENTPAASEEMADEVGSSAVADKVGLSDVEMDINLADPLTDNDGPMIPLEALDLDLTADHEIAATDLELLERDYAAQTETNTNLEDIASAGRGNKTSIIETSLDMEFPEEVKMRQEADAGFDTLEFDTRSESLDFDIGLTEDGSETAEELGLDLEEAGANIDAQLEQLHLTDSMREQIDPTLQVEIDPEESSDGLDPENLLTEDDTTSMPTRDAEEFYHLEASSIMNIGELDFEQEPDDETNVLRFRQRNIRTGTDDPAGDDD